MIGFVMHPVSVRGCRNVLTVMVLLVSMTFTSRPRFALAHDSGVLGSSLIVSTHGVLKS
jgi:hypothetical protein